MSSLEAKRFRRSLERQHLQRHQYPLNVLNDGARMLHLAESTKGGLGDVRDLTPDEFEFWYASLMHLNKLKRKAQKEMQAAMSKGGPLPGDEPDGEQSWEERMSVLRGG